MDGLLPEDDDKSIDIVYFSKDKGNPLEFLDHGGGGGCESHSSLSEEEKKYLTEHFIEILKKHKTDKKPNVEDKDIV